jgi:hypothetical protein
MRDHCTAAGVGPVLLASLALGLGASASAQMLPTDHAILCPVTPATFKGWFESGTPTPNGRVKPADSVNFPDQPNCSFYEWSQQMFLWLTSANAAGSERNFVSSSFFDVLPLDQNGARTMVPHASAGTPLQLRVAQVGPNNRPIVFDKKGRMFEVQPPEFGPNGGRLVRLPQDKVVELGSIQLAQGGAPRFLDRQGKPITAKLTLPSDKTKTADTLSLPTLRRFAAGNRVFFLDAAGNIIDVEQGQAGGDSVLMSQKGSLVYYGIHVNDVFAYFLSGAKTGGIAPVPTQFPTTQAQLDQVIAFAQQKGKTLSHPQARAMEIKTAWVEAAGLDTSKYITMTATIPTYDASDPAKQKWTFTGTRSALLAMVGMHVVGSAKGHPEMIWATYEHVDNAPPEAYSYLTASNQVKTVARNTVGNWHFAASGSAGPFNVERAVFEQPNLVASSGQTLGPSDTLRWKAFGAAEDRSPNPISGSTPRSNSEIISINSSVMGQLAADDVRRHYILTGATWTINGQPPKGDGSNQVGTNQLANTTMETYQQSVDAKFNPDNNCFACHRSNKTGVSRIFTPLKPLVLP